MEKKKEQKCSKCGAPMECGIESGKKDCWCFSYPPLSVVDETGCMCPECLGKAVAQDSAKNADTL